ncbi:hypothetical protein BJV78DRAFT_654160 [Lactifluus subvellereus]|nr:hypothetical protein BJV78DRAFT_654160 [Lactifluus subvellereus]
MAHAPGRARVNFVLLTFLHGIRPFASRSVSTYASQAARRAFGVFRIPVSSILRPEKQTKDPPLHRPVPSSPTLAAMPHRPPITVLYKVVLL